MPRRAPARIVSVMLLVGLALGASSHAAAQSLEWDQPRVTAVAQELKDATHQMRRALRRQPPPNMGSMQAHSWQRLADQLQLIERESRELVRRLEAGRGHDGTLRIYRRLRVSIRNAQENARRVFIPDAVGSRGQVALEVLSRLAPFYAPDPLDSAGDETAPEQG